MPVQDALRSSRPTIVIDGETYPAVASALRELALCDSDAGLAHGSLTLENWGPRNGGTDYQYFDLRVFDFGKKLEVRLGDDVLFKGRISAIEASFDEGAPPTITVLAEDRLQSLRMSRRTRVFEDMSDADVIRQIANDHGLQAEVSLSGDTHRVLAQANDTDLAFLRERARRGGFEIWADGDTLHAAERSSRRAAPVTLTTGASLRSFRVVADLAHQVSSVSIGGWDVAAKDALKGEAEASSLSSEGGGQRGADLVSSKLSARTEAVTHSFPATASEADAIARAWLAQRARRFVVAHGVTETTSDLKVGARIKIEGVGPLFKGDYDLVGVTHRFDNRIGLRTEIALERAWIGEPA
ncbi:contractile injection system protein, VgrG/Pvc8 family [Niveibacterium sp. 24ML]|uniref:phage late control D family protein n=1 Tax=Niveibacterium sp. 24ML TaxID=2985512 RepID=UPI00226FDA3C|nr:contractile injection system protein, VgrG/Pvc8 family [Niveibacterium sp. 24ML]MCX9158487.1 contractile injection system protein, VgrG/Pvc8 family [Niveibacterium sp. 24ML]